MQKGTIFAMCLLVVFCMYSSPLQGKGVPRSLLHRTAQQQEKNVRRGIDFSVLKGYLRQLPVQEKNFICFLLYKDITSGINMQKEGAYFLFLSGEQAGAFFHQAADEDTQNEIFSDFSALLAYLEKLPDEKKKSLFTWLLEDLYAQYAKKLEARLTQRDASGFLRKI